MSAAAVARFAISASATDLPQFFPVEKHALQQVSEGRNTFRYSTFGDEAFWGDGLGLHLAIAGAANGGVGPGLSPTAALAAVINHYDAHFSLGLTAGDKNDLAEYLKSL